MHALEFSANFVTQDQAKAARMERVEAIYREHYQFVRRGLRYLGVPEDDIRDALQNVFIVVVQRIEGFQGRSSIRTWLFGIAFRVAQNARRRRQKHQRVPATLEPPREPTLPDQALARTEAAAMLERLLDQLDDDQRAVFVMADIEGLKVPEIADGLGLKLNTAYSRLRLARQKFERGLARERARQHRGGLQPCRSR